MLWLSDITFGGPSLKIKKNLKNKKDESALFRFEDSECYGVKFKKKKKKGK